MAAGKIHREPAIASGDLRARLHELEVPAPAKGPDSRAAIGTTGAQAGIYARALDAANTALPLLEILEVGSEASEAHDVQTLKTVIRSEFTELVGELALASGPHASRVEQIFSLLLDQLGALQEGIEDDENLTSFRVVADHVASLYRSWNNVQQLFATQTALILQQLKLVSEAVEEVRFTMDAVFIGPEERKGMPIRFAAWSGERPAISVEDLLMWVQDFAISEGPELIEASGGFALGNAVYPTARKLASLVTAAMDGRNMAHFPKRCSTPPLQRAMKNLEARLDELAWNC